jgi:hypothetical protein
MIGLSKGSTFRVNNAIQFFDRGAIRVFVSDLAPVPGRGNGGLSSFGECMQKKLFVGGLPYSTQQDEIRDLFAQCGEVVSATIVRDRFTNQSRGFGFVEMATEEQAAEAIKKLNGTQLGGRTIIVNESRPKERTGGDRDRH